MSQVVVKPISLPGGAKAFVKSWWGIYEGEPGWSAPLMMDRMKFFDPARNPYFKHGTVQCFTAEKGGKIVGTIAATVDHEKQRTDPGVGFIGFYEFIDDEEVARGLFEAAKAWLKEKGMTSVEGPFNFNSNHDFGLLVDGFDTPNAIANPHARPYYGPMYEKVGLTRLIDWYAYWLEAGEVPESVKKISDRLLERNPQLTLRPVNMKNFAKEIENLQEIYNDAWEDNWGHIHLSKEEFDAIGADFKQVIDPNLCWVAEWEGETVAVSITLPDYNQVFKKMNGSLFPFGWWYFLTAKSHINQLRVFILGVKKKYQRLPLGAPLYIKTWEEGMKRGVKGAEASLILENNTRMRGALEKLGGKIYKTYRIYSAKL